MGSLWNDYQTLFMLNAALEDIERIYKQAHEVQPTTVTTMDLQRLACHTFHSSTRLRRAVRAAMFQLEQQQAQGTLDTL